MVFLSFVSKVMLYVFLKISFLFFLFFFFVEKKLLKNIKIPIYFMKIHPTNAFKFAGCLDVILSLFESTKLCSAKNWNPKKSFIKLII